MNNDIETLKDLFVKELNPVAVYLFGSYAEKRETDDSDYDFYIIVKDSEKDMLRLTAKAYKAIRDKRNRPVDIIVNTERTFDERKKRVSSVESEVARKGVLLYGRKRELEGKEGSESVSGTIPRIKSIEALDDLVLKVTFDGGEEVLYDVKEDVKDIPDFRPLETEPHLFNNFTLDSSRTCVTWTDRIDLPSDTILEYGKKVTKE